MPLWVCGDARRFYQRLRFGQLEFNRPGAGRLRHLLYNLRLGIEDIRAGRSRIACGCGEAPVNIEVMDGYVAMGALATDKGLRQLDGLSEDAQPDNRRACRPFGDNCGFTMAESAQVVILMDDALALELGAPILASAPCVSVRADGAKNPYRVRVRQLLTVAESVATVRGILGDERLVTGAWFKPMAPVRPRTGSRVDVAEQSGPGVWRV